MTGFKSIDQHEELENKRLIRAANLYGVIQDNALSVEFTSDEIMGIAGKLIIFDYPGSRGITSRQSPCFSESDLKYLVDLGVLDFDAKEKIYSVNHTSEAIPLFDSLIQN